MSEPRVPIHRGDHPDLVARVANDVAEVGASVATDMVASAWVSELREFVDQALVEDDAWHRPTDVDDVGRVTFLPRYGPLPLELLDNDSVVDPVDALLGDDASLYTVTTLCQPPRARARPVHLDLEYRPPNYLLGVGVIVLLDDYTPTSGLMRIYPEITDDPPSWATFEARALRLEAPAGSVCWFNGAVWHDVLANQTSNWRRSILFAFTRSWVRPRFDMPRMVAHLDEEKLSSRVQRRLGMQSMPPGSYEEYYLPAADRRRRLLHRARRP